MTHWYWLRHAEERAIRAVGNGEVGLKSGEVVEPRGVEPLTFSLRTRRSTN